MRDASEHCRFTPEMIDDFCHPKVPLRVDFAGGWLDCPQFAVEGGYIVNCTIEPFDAHPGGGLGGSARAAILDGQCPFEAESKIAGWQDAAVITETGFCVWRSGPKPVLEAKHNPDFLRGRMALLWTGTPHDTASLVNTPRNYALIERAGDEARPRIGQDLSQYVRYGIQLSYEAQIAEGMPELPYEGNTRKYCGAGWGGYALYFFYNEQQRANWLRTASEYYEVRPIEPYMRGYC